MLDNGEARLDSETEPPGLESFALIIADDAQHSEYVKALNLTV